MSKQQKVSIPKSLTASYYETQAEMLAVGKKKGQLSIGVPKEITMQESRVSLIPSAVATLVSRGHKLLVEKEAGVKAHYPDYEYSEAGASIAYSPEALYKADIIIKVAPPTMEELELMRPNQILISPLHLPVINAEYVTKLKQKRIIALAMEYIKDESDTFPFVRTMSEIAGIGAMLTAAELLFSEKHGGRGILLGSISGVPPARIVILGAGVVAEYATRAALGLGAEVRIFDNNVHKLKRIQNLIGRPLYTSTLNPHYLRKELMRADAAIGAIHSTEGRAPIVVNENMVKAMKPGSVIVDVSIDQGGCFATSRMTTHEKPTFKEYDVTHYCVPNIAAKVSRTASIAVSNIFTSILLRAGEAGGLESLLLQDLGLRKGVYTYKGCLTNTYLGERFQIKSTDLDLLITSSL